MLDTGAMPNVMDRKMARLLGLEESIVPSGRVFGLCNTPVGVLGYVDVAITIGDADPVVERIKVLDSDQPTLLVGRRFMGQMGQVIFDWDNCRVKLGQRWIPAQTALSGSTPLARAIVAKQEEEVEKATRNETLILSDKLSEEDKSKIQAVVSKFDRVFARNHKRPSRCQLNESHAILTGDAPPQKSRPRRVPPHWEPEINKQLEEMLSASPPICQPSKSPWASDVVLVKKRDGSLRFAVDYRRLNGVTKRDEYSLPNP